MSKVITLTVPANKVTQLNGLLSKLYRAQQADLEELKSWQSTTSPDHFHRLQAQAKYQTDDLVKMLNDFHKQAGVGLLRNDLFMEIFPNYKA